MSAPHDSDRLTAKPNAMRRLHRSETDRVVAGVAGGLGEYFGVDPVWFRVGFVILTVGGGAGLLIYLIMWLVVKPAPGDYEPGSSASGRLTGAVVVGIAFIAVGAIALVNTVAPSLGRYFWPVVLILGGLALVLGGVNRDIDR